MNKTEKTTTSIAAADNSKVTRSPGVARGLPWEPGQATHRSRGWVLISLGSGGKISSYTVWFKIGFIEDNYNVERKKQTKKIKQNKTTYDSK